MALAAVILTASASPAAADPVANRVSLGQTWIAQWGSEYVADTCEDGDYFSKRVRAEWNMLVTSTGITVYSITFTLYNESAKHGVSYGPFAVIGDNSDSGGPAWTYVYPGSSRTQTVTFNTHIRWNSANNVRLLVSSSIPCFPGGFHHTHVFQLTKGF